MFKFSRNIGLLVMSMALVASAAGCSSRQVGYPAGPVPSASAVETSAPVTVTDYASNPAPTSAYATTNTVTSTAPASAPPSLIPEDNPTIVIGFDGKYDPEAMKVSVGATVDFLNNDCCNPHVLHSDFPFDMKMEPLGTVQFKFTRAGNYIFWLDNTQWVYGTITVA